MQGTLVLVVSPSGAGKDSVIEGARAALDGAGGFRFARRCITRPRAAGGEAHRAVAPESFARARAEGAFALSWNAHGLGYGIPKGIERDLARGRCVVANVSRTVVEEACARYAPVLVVHITAPRDVLVRRLASRGREGDADIRARLDRTVAWRSSGAGIAEISNDGPLAATVERLVAVLLAQNHCGSRSLSATDPV